MTLALSPVAWDQWLSPRGFGCPGPLVLPPLSSSPISDGGPLWGGKTAPLSLLSSKALSYQTAEAALGAARMAGTLGATERTSSQTLIRAVPRNCPVPFNTPCLPELLGNQKQNHRGDQTGKAQTVLLTHLPPSSTMMSTRATHPGANPAGPHTSSSVLGAGSLKGSIRTHIQTH